MHWKRLNTSFPRQNFDSLHAYVALSRVRSLDGLAILRDFSFDVISKLAKPTDDMIKEMTRLQKISEKTTNEV